VDPYVLDKLHPRRAVLELLDQCSGDADVIHVKKGLVEWLVGVDRNDQGFIHSLPFQIYR
jgi:hypothetical protein